MKALISLALGALLPLSAAQADVTIKGDRMEISDDCRKIEGDVMTLRSEDCEDGSKGGNKNKGDNRSIHGDDNPGKGHGKDKNNKGKDRDKDDD
ncbi:CG2 omega domain protein [Vibrio maritimus]